MKEITKEEFEALEIIRNEYYRNYIYALAKVGNGFATVSRYQSGPFSYQEIEYININIPLEQDKIDYINDHSIIHINPKKNVWRWRD